MELFESQTIERACCSFCRKPLPRNSGQPMPWRAATGELFCNEFCADDAEEARFQNRRAAYRPLSELRRI
jgi:hypothetical protein